VFVSLSLSVCPSVALYTCELSTVSCCLATRRHAIACPSIQCPFEDAGRAVIEALTVDRAGAAAVPSTAESCTTELDATTGNEPGIAAAAGARHPELQLGGAARLVITVSRAANAYVARRKSVAKSSSVRGA